MNSDIAAQEMLADAPKGTQKSPQPRPHALGRVRVHFTDAVPIIVARPFVVSVCDHRARALNRVIAVVLIGIDMRSLPGETLDMLSQGRLLRVGSDPQTDLPTLASNRPQDGRTVIN